MLVRRSEVSRDKPGLGVISYLITWVSGIFSVSRGYPGLVSIRFHSIPCNQRLLGSDFRIRVTRNNLAATETRNGHVIACDVRAQHEQSTLYTLASVLMLQVHGNVEMVPSLDCSDMMCTESIFSNVEIEL